VLAELGIGADAIEGLRVQGAIGAAYS